MSSLPPPPPRTSTVQQTVFRRPYPAAVTYDLGVADQATITLPAGSAWTSGAHWHDAHTEYLRVLSGCARVAIGGQVLPAVRASDGVLAVPRGAVHEWRRSDVAGLDADLVVREWTDPQDGAKEVFFRNLNSLILDADTDADVASTSSNKGSKGGGGSGSSSSGQRARDLGFELRILFWKMDNYPLVLGPSWPAWIQRSAARANLLWAALQNWSLRALGAGRNGIYEEYTPSHLHEWVG